MTRRPTRVQRVQRPVAMTAGPPPAPVTRSSFPPPVRPASAAPGRAVMWPGPPRLGMGWLSLTKEGGGATSVLFFRETDRSYTIVATSR